MIEALFFGLTSGLFLSFGFGSVFFALIQNSLDYGYKAGIKIAFGVIIGDFILIAIAILGTKSLPQIPSFDFYSRIFGAILLFALGFSQFKKINLSQRIETKRFIKFLYFVMKGFLLNVLNPVNFLSWVILSSTLKSYHYTLNQEIVFFVSSMLMIFIVESLLSLFANRVSTYFSAQMMQRIKQITGIVFIFIGIKLLMDAYIS